MKLLIAAGGTGGHVFPGLAVGERLVAMNKTHVAVYTGTDKGLESKVIPRHGFRLILIPASQFTGRSTLYKIATLFRLIAGIVRAMAVIRREKPDAILGMGGFTTVSVVLAGFMMGYPCFLHEQNVEAGLANRVLAKYVKGVFVSFKDTLGYGKSKKIRHAGNPLRKSLTSPQIKKGGDRFSVFIFGGSRGARSINDAVLSLLPLIDGNRRIAMYHQTGADDLNRVREGYRKTAIEHEVFPFTDDMEKYYTVADLVICRAGATTIFELAYFRKPAILIPYPFAAGQHQWKNAAYVESVGGAYLVGNDEATGDRLFEVITSAMKEPEALGRMSENIGKIYVKDSAERIIRGIEDGIS